MRYTPVTEEDLETLAKGLGILERLDRDVVQKVDVYLYATTQDEGIIEVAKDAIAHGSYDEDEDVSENDVTLAEVGIAIPLSEDMLYALMGSGLRVDEFDFVYKPDGGEGVRTGRFRNADHGKNTKITLSRLEELNIGDTDSWLDDYFAATSKAAPAHIDRKVRRDNVPATAPEPTSDSLESPPPTTPQPKVTSRSGGSKLNSFLEDFLG